MHIQSSNYPDCARAIHHHLLDRIASVICGRQINDIAISGCCDPAADPAPYPPLLSRNWGSESIQHRREGKKEAKREREREREVSLSVQLASFAISSGSVGDAGLTGRRRRRRRWHQPFLIVSFHGNQEKTEKSRQKKKRNRRRRKKKKKKKKKVQTLPEHAPFSPSP